MAHPSYPSGGIDVNQIREDSDKYYRTVEWHNEDLVSPPTNLAAIPIYTVPRNGTCELDTIRYKMVTAPTDAAGNDTTFQLSCVRAGTDKTAIAVVHNTAIAFNNTRASNTWVVVPAADIVAAFTKFYPGDSLHLTIALAGVPTDGVDPYCEVILRPDF